MFIVIASVTDEKDHNWYKYHGKEKSYGKRNPRHDLIFTPNSIFGVGKITTRKGMVDIRLANLRHIKFKLTRLEADELLKNSSKFTGKLPDPLTQRVRKIREGKNTDRFTPRTTIINERTEIDRANYQWRKSTHENPLVVRTPSSRKTMRILPNEEFGIRFLGEIKGGYLLNLDNYRLRISSAVYDQLVTLYSVISTRQYKNKVVTKGEEEQQKAEELEQRKIKRQERLAKKQKEEQEKIAEKERLQQERLAKQEENRRLREINRKKKADEAAQQARKETVHITPPLETKIIKEDKPVNEPEKESKPTVNTIHSRRKNKELDDYIFTPNIRRPKSHLAINLDAEDDEDKRIDVVSPPVTVSTPDKNPIKAVPITKTNHDIDVLDEYLNAYDDGDAFMPGDVIQLEKDIKKRQFLILNKQLNGEKVVYTMYDLTNLPQQLYKISVKDGSTTDYLSNKAEFQRQVSAEELESILHKTKNFK